MGAVMHMVRRENLIQMPDRVGSMRRVVDWLSERLRETCLKATTKKAPAQMSVIETMSLGGRRELMLVNCCGKQFLVAASAEAIQSVVPLRVPRKGRQETRKVKCEETV